MLDVMRNPPPVPESITWHACRVQLPVDDRKVMFFVPEDETEPVWEGWYDPKQEVWYTLEGMPLPNMMITWWADCPKGPEEPKPGQAPRSRS